MKKVKITYTDYPSIDEIQAFIYFGFITKLVKPVKRVFSYWDLDNQEVEIEEITKEQIIEICENEDYTMQEEDSYELNLEFDNGDVLCLCCDAGESTLTYFWEE